MYDKSTNQYNTVSGWRIDPIHLKQGIQSEQISQDVWAERYAAPGEHSILATFDRVANAIMPEGEQKATYDAMCKGLWMPGGRILAGAGTDKRVTLMNCYVVRDIEDHMEGIADALKDSMLTMQQGGGIGLDFSTLRPAGALLKRTGAEASGPLPFMDMWNAMCHTIMSAGSRRGAMMAVMHCSHPDIYKFITAKSEKGRLTNFNVSVLVTDEFMKAVESDGSWDLVFNVPLKAGVHTQKQTASGQYVYQTISARQLWSDILHHTYEYSEPGIIFIDRINKQNNLQYCEYIHATNPCGEQPLPPNGTCNLGAVNLAKMVHNPFTPNAVLDFNLLRDIVRLGVRFLDNVIDKTNYPLEAQQQEELNKRRIGLGISGLHNALMQLGIPYGNNEACRAVVGNIMEEIAYAAYDASADLALEKGTFPLYNKRHIMCAPFINRKLPRNLQLKIHEQGLRNGVLLTIAPTGTTSIVYGNVSSGLEPVFNYSYQRKVLQSDGTHKEYTVYDYAYLLYHTHHNAEIGSIELPDHFVTAEQLSVDDHLAVQAQCQQYVDASISKTINCPESMSYEDFQDVYTKAYKLGLKGCTTYRPSPIRGSVLANTSKDNKSAEAPKSKTAGTHALRSRPFGVQGTTYKLKWPSMDSALYVTINDLDGRPFEIFIATKSAKYIEWTTALTRMISSIMRTQLDISFVYEELQQVNSAHDSAWIEGKYIGSIVAYIGNILEAHVKRGTECAAGSSKDDAIVNPAPDSASVCPKCAAPAYIHQEGCGLCHACGFSNCG